MKKILLSTLFTMSSLFITDSIPWASEQVLVASPECGETIFC